MDYDHVRGEKVSNVGDMAQEAYGIIAIEAEIAKCDLVCANCHRLRTWLRHHPDDIHSRVAQRQSGRLLPCASEVRILPRELAAV